MEAQLEVSAAEALHDTAERRALLLSALSSLWFVRHRITIVARTPLLLPVEARGKVLRGAFGISLRRLVCHDLDLACRECPLESTCPYPQTFEPRPPADTDRLSKLAGHPAPFRLCATCG